MDTSGIKVQEQNNVMMTMMITLIHASKTARMHSVVMALSGQLLTEELKSVMMQIMITQILVYKIVWMPNVVISSYGILMEDHSSAMMETRATITIA